MVISGAMDLDTASNVLGYRITGCSPEKKKPRTDVDTKEAKSTEPPRPRVTTRSLGMA